MTSLKPMAKENQQLEQAKVKLFSFLQKPRICKDKFHSIVICKVSANKSIKVHFEESGHRIATDITLCWYKALEITFDSEPYNKNENLLQHSQVFICNQNFRHKISLPDGISIFM